MVELLYTLGADPSAYSNTQTRNSKKTNTSSGSIVNSFRDIFAPFPTIDVFETNPNGDVQIHADLPGMTEDSIGIDVNRDMITISGERTIQYPAPSNNTNRPPPQLYSLAHSHPVERSHGKFSRTIQLPFSPNPENVSATYVNGVLSIVVPNESRPAGRIKVNAVSRLVQPSSDSPPAEATD